MKTKKNSKKLNLKKMTVSNLSTKKLDMVKGGVDMTCAESTCFTPPIK